MKKYAVDVFWEYARSYEVEAESREDAERKIEALMLAPHFDPLKNGFEMLEDFDVRCSGETDDSGAMTYF